MNIEGFETEQRQDTLKVRAEQTMIDEASYKTT